MVETLVQRSNGEGVAEVGRSAPHTVSDLQISIPTDYDINIGVLPQGYREDRFSDRVVSIRPKGHGLREVDLAELRVLAAERAQLLRVPVPRLGFIDVDAEGCFIIQTNSIGFGRQARPETCRAILAHEMEHLAQAKFIAAAKIAAPELFRDFIIDPAIEKAADDQRLHLRPICVRIGQMFIDSTREVEVHRKRSEQTSDIDEYLKLRHKIRSSIEELAADVSRHEIEVVGHRESAKRLREQAVHLRECSIWSIQGVKSFLNAWSCDSSARRFDKRADVASRLMQSKTEELALRLACELDRT